MINKINDTNRDLDFFASWDSCFDKIPFVSTITNSFEILGKLFAHLSSKFCKNQNSLYGNRVFKHIVYDKSLKENILLSIPFIGNIIVWRHKNPTIQEIQQNPAIFTKADNRMKNNKAFVIARLKENCTIFDSISQNLQQDLDVIQAKKNVDLLQTTKKQIDTALSQSEEAIKALESQAKEKKQRIQNILKDFGDVLKDSISDVFKTLESNHQQLNLSLHVVKDEINGQLNQQNDIFDGTQPLALLKKTLAERKIQQDKITLQLAHSKLEADYIVKKFGEDRVFSLNALKITARAFDLISDNLKKDPDILFEAAKWDYSKIPVIIQILQSSLEKKDRMSLKTLMEKIVDKDGMAIQYIPLAIQDETLSEKAVSQNYQALKHINQKYQTNSVFLAAIKQNHLALELIAPNKKRNEEFMKKAREVNSNVS